MSIEYKKEEEREDLSVDKPHVVLLGAGATKAAFPDGDKNGRSVPLMDKVAQELNLESILEKADIESPFDDFEQVYDEMAHRHDVKEYREKIEHEVFEYFNNLEITEKPTIYDYLILSLRSKDIIATFNWDPFLWLAYERNKDFADCPEILFLHGNVAVGRCNDCGSIGRRGEICKDCKEEFSSIPLLFPVKEKDYNQDHSISEFWERIRDGMNNACGFTVFGYSAPETDVEAIDLLKDGWGDIESRNMEEIEVVDLECEAILQKKWERFIHTHHYKVFKDFFATSIARHPRRVCEAHQAQFWEAKFVEGGERLNQKMTFSKIYDLLKPKIQKERSYRDF